MKLDELPPEFRSVVEAMKPEMQAVVLNEALDFSDFARAADFRLREDVATYGPSRMLVCAIDRLQEAHMWRGCFDPKTDAVVKPPELPVAPPIVTATQADADELAKLVGRKKKGK